MARKTPSNRRSNNTRNTARTSDTSRRGSSSSSGRRSSERDSSSQSRQSTQATGSRRSLPQKKPLVLRVADFVMRPFRYENGKPKRRNIIIALCVVAAAAVIALLAGLIWSFTHINAANVYIDSDLAGIIAWDKKSEVNAEYIEKMTVLKLESNLGTGVQLTQKITMESIHASSNDTIAFDNLLETLTKKCAYNIEAAAITIDGEQLGILQNTSIAETVLKNVKDSYYQEDLNITKAEFVEDMDVASIYVSSDTKFMTSDKAYSLLSSTTSTPEIYTVQSGDTFSRIASAYGMTTDEIRALNPNIDETKLQIGQELNITSQKPMVSVRTYERVTYIEVIPKTTEYVNNDSQYITYSKVIQQGSDGQREVTADKIRVNGIQVDIDIISENIITDAVPEIIEVGTSKTVNAR